MAERRIATVTQINTYIKSLLNSNAILQDIWVRGEISNFKLHYSGHIYMTLKDEMSTLKTVMFKSYVQNIPFRPENGMKVLVRGRISVFERDGTYQLYAEEMQLDGVGDLHIAFEQLKEKLKAEGLFDPKYKKPIPKYPRRIGVITSPTGAAIRDILNVLNRRYKCADVYIYPVLVQGEGASAEIKEAIEFFNEKKYADVLIVGRGGGSIEDLWAFNEEVTARAIFASEIPVISAVGHETDFTISDFVADLRAPTPSAAAEMAVPSEEELRERIKAYERNIRLLMERILKNKRQKLDLLRKSPALVRFKSRIDERRMLIDREVLSLTKDMKNKLNEYIEKLSSLASRLNAINPLSVLDRGYSITQNEEGKTIKNISEVNVGDNIKVRLSDGHIFANVYDTKPAIDKE
ncbi:MAG: exodeoxyribonuclease VII large subunit [Clostridiaceae bacterium]|nr:exodeoxyribonuclease VII large subunit [Clostridiaceae bacterium]